MGFRSLIKEVSKRRRSNVVVALDLPIETIPSTKLVAKGVELIRSVQPYVCGAKVNRQTTIVLSFAELRNLVKRIHDLGLPVIMDSKLNDVGHTNARIAGRYFDAGFDAITASPLVGWIDGLSPVFKSARALRKGVILLVHMSHKGSVEGYGQMIVDRKTEETYPLYGYFSRLALKWGADGVVVGATYPERISEIHAVLGDEVPIYCPGIGPQGGVIERAIDSGATYLIVGRSIISRSDPAAAAKMIRERALKALRSP